MPATRWPRSASIPEAAAKAIWEKGGKATFDVARIDAIERETKHDVIAFLTHLAEHRRARGALRPSGHDLSDVLDTCLSVQLHARRRHPASPTSTRCSPR